MVERNYATRHKTLLSLKAAGLKLFAFCNNPDCRWSAVLDTDDLIDRLGEGHSTLPTAMVPRLVCSQCGSKSVGVILTAAKEVPSKAAEHIKAHYREEDQGSSAGSGSSS
jgi:hypothetical protein